MGYYIDLEKITIEDYCRKLQSAYLPPSRLILKENPEERFAYFRQMGIKNLKSLLIMLRKKDKFAELSKLEYFSGNYLTILLRELNSTLPKPNKIADFAGISKDTVLKLEKAGIKNTEKLYERVLTKTDRQELAGSLGINQAELLELTGLADLSRIKWVGVTFARMLFDLGINSVEKATKADPLDLHEKVNKLNREKSIYKGQIGLNDMKIFVDAAKEIPLEIEY